MNKVYLLAVIVTIIFGACSTTKNIPDGQYLLNNVEFKTDNKIPGAVELEAYLRQEPNSSFPLIGKYRLGIYNIGSDTTKLITRLFRKMGEAPVIYSARQTKASATQIQKELVNLGFLNAEVDTILKLKKKKIDVTYNITIGEPYRIRNYSINIEDSTMMRILSKVPSTPRFREGMPFDMALLETERERVNNIMRNLGYYNFSKEYLYFKADTTLNSHQVDLYMHMYPAKDSLPYPRYKINEVVVYSGFRGMPNQRDLRRADTTEYNNITIVKRRGFLRSSVISRNNSLKKGMYYSDYLYTRTYENFSNIGAINQTNIILKPSENDSTRLLDAYITLSPSNAHWFKAGVDGTNSAGDIGIAPSVAYSHQNLFNGGEQLSIRLKGAYEFVTGTKTGDLMNENYYEIGGDVSLTLPQILFPYIKREWRELPYSSTKFSIGLNNQHRQAYTRQFFNATLNYGWQTQRGRLQHSLDLIDVNYVRMPWVSDQFREDYLNEQTNPLLKASYEDQLIARTGYNITIGNKRSFSSRPDPNTYTIRGGIEIAGLLPRIAATIDRAKPNDRGSKEIMGVVYAEYVKGTADYARTLKLSRNTTLAYHVGGGLAYPYGNSSVLPFERRFFAGGANSVRGWSTRSLGPGAYSESTSGKNYVYQTGDIKLESSVEIRRKISTVFELAAFVDAGNIWTIKEYQNQEGGEFNFSKFYKEIAIAYGGGLRFDLTFLVLRFDAGMRAYDPGRPQSERLVIFKPSFSKMALHFGIGYPF